MEKTGQRVQVPNRGSGAEEDQTGKPVGPGESGGLQSNEGKQVSDSFNSEALVNEFLLQDFQLKTQESLKPVYLDLF